MPTLTSRILLAFEMLLLGVPAISSFFMFAFASLEAAVDPRRSMDSPTSLVLIVLIGSFLLAAYRVAFAFIHKGPRALKILHKGWWWLSIAGAAYAVLTTLLTTYYYGSGKDLGLMVKTTGMFGLLYLFPLGHVLLEKKFRKDCAERQLP